MSVFMGGSVHSMAKEVMDGYILVTPHVLKKYNLEQLKSLNFELEKLLRELRGQNYPTEDAKAVQQRNRKSQRISTAMLTIRNFATQRYKRF